MRLVRFVATKIFNSISIILLLLDSDVQFIYLLFSLVSLLPFHRTFSVFAWLFVNDFWRARRNGFGWGAFFFCVCALALVLTLARVQ